MVDDRHAVDLDEVYQFAVQLGQEAGSLLMDAAHLRYGSAQRTDHLEKESAVDLVTQTDEGQSCDAFIVCHFLDFGELQTIHSGYQVMSRIGKKNATATATATCRAPGIPMLMYLS